MTQPYSENTVCPICLEGIVLRLPLGDDVFQGRCGHAAHIECLRAAVRQGSYNCPNCRCPFGEVPVVVEQSLLKYAKMLKTGIAQAAVRQRMISDNISLAAIDSFFTGGASVASQTEKEIIEIRTKQRAACEKYTKMLALGMNEGAVKQKMRAAGISDDIINEFFKESD